MAEYGLPDRSMWCFGRRTSLNDYRLYSPINDGPQSLMIHFKAT